MHTLWENGAEGPYAPRKGVGVRMPLALWWKQNYSFWILGDLG